MAKGKITTDEWHAELKRLGAIGDGDKGKTAHELHMEYGIPLRRMQRIISDGVLVGTFTQGHGYRKDACGRRQRVPVYRVKEGEI